MNDCYTTFVVTPPTPLWSAYFDCVDDCPIVPGTSPDGYGNFTTVWHPSPLCWTLEDYDSGRLLLAHERVAQLALLAQTASSSDLAAEAMDLMCDSWGDGFVRAHYVDLYCTLILRLAISNADEEARSAILARICDAIAGGDLADLCIPARLTVLGTAVELAANDGALDQLSLLIDACEPEAWQEANDLNDSRALLTE